MPGSGGGNECELLAGWREDQVWLQEAKEGERSPWWDGGGWVVSAQATEGFCRSWWRNFRLYSQGSKNLLEKFKKRSALFILTFFLNDLSPRPSHCDLTGCRPKDQKIIGSIPSQGNMPGWWVQFPGQGMYERHPSMFCSHMDVSLPCLLLPSVPSLQNQ